MITKSVNLTEEEISVLISYHGSHLANISSVEKDHSEPIERINYLHKRLKAFKEPEEVKPTAAGGGWGNSNG